MSLENPINVYVCETCGGEIVTRDVDEGVTPFMLACRATPGCNGRMTSRFYNVDPRYADHVTHEWFRPSKAVMQAAGADAREHYKGGGLDLRRAGESCSVLAEDRPTARPRFRRGASMKPKRAAL
jgi:hypothetical protein